MTIAPYNFGPVRDNDLLNRTTMAVRRAPVD